MRYVLAISGGIDSVVLLHLFVTRYGHDAVVAHFDHGIRPDSAADARFVKGLAAHYGVQYEARREELGSAASEDLARQRRYAFLLDVAKRYDSKLVTAHHRDDVVESIAINLSRGTGWRGLGVMDDPRITRPLLGYGKADIRQYALAYHLEWVEDATNASEVYLRNRLRRRIATRLSEDSKVRLLGLRGKQLHTKHQIDYEVEQLLKERVCSRYDFIMYDYAVALELLRALFVQLVGVPLTRPQRERALVAIKTARPGNKVEVGEQVTLELGKREFVVVTLAKML